MAGNSKCNPPRGRYRPRSLSFLAPLLHPRAAALNQQTQNHHEQNSGDDPNNCGIHRMFSLPRLNFRLLIRAGAGSQSRLPAEALRGA